MVRKHAILSVLARLGAASQQLHIDFMPFRPSQSVKEHHQHATEHFQIPVFHLQGRLNWPHSTLFAVPWALPKVAQALSHPLISNKSP